MGEGRAPVLLSPHRVHLVRGGAGGAHFITLLDLINASEARENDEEFQSPVDLLFAKLEKEHPDHFAVKQYRKFKMAAGKTLA